MSADVGRSERTEMVCIASPRSEVALDALRWIASGVNAPRGEAAR